MGSVAKTFADLRTRKQFGLVPFIPAGYPDLATTRAALPELQAAGATVIEVGIPFSDPIADGPTIQTSYTAALAKGLRLSEIFETLAAARDSVSVPLVAMVSYSVPFRYGVERFCHDAKAAGVSGLIIPDLPPPEAAGVCKIVNAAGLDTTLLIAPTTPEKRQREIAELTTGFIYYLSVSGITGERDRLPEDLESKLRGLRKLTDKPLCVGFGISKPEHLAQLAPLADGAIVGSAIVKRMTEAASAGQNPEQIAATIGAYCRSLLSGVR